MKTEWKLMAASLGTTSKCGLSRRRRRCLTDGVSERQRGEKKLKKKLNQSEQEGLMEQLV